MNNDEKILSLLETLVSKVDGLEKKIEGLEKDTGNIRGEIIRNDKDNDRKLDILFNSILKLLEVEGGISGDVGVIKIDQKKHELILNWINSRMDK